MIVLFQVAWLILAGATGSTVEFARQQEPLSRVRKIQLKYADAIELASDLGGSIELITGRTHDRPPPSLMPGWGWSYSSGGLAQLLPNDVEGIIGLEIDNTILVKGTQQAIEDTRQLIQMVDLPPLQVECRADASLTVTDLRGKARHLGWHSTGRGTSGRPIHLKAVTEGTGAPASESYDLDIIARAIGDGSIHVQADWYVDVRWPAAGGKAVRIRNVFRTDGSVVAGGTIIVGRATNRVPDGSAELALRITPRRLPDSPARP